MKDKDQISFDNRAATSLHLLLRFISLCLFILLMISMTTPPPPPTRMALFFETLDQDFQRFWFFSF